MDAFLNYIAGRYKMEAEKVALNPHVSVDCIIFGYDFEELKVLLIERNYFESEDQQQHKKITDWLLPGNLVRDNENLDASAKRILKELTGLENIFLEQFYTFGDPNRVRKKQDLEWLRALRAQPDARVITVAYFALVKLHDYVPKPHSFARKLDWYPIENIPKLAFDHNEIVSKGLEALRLKLKYVPIGFELLPPKFTLSQVQKLYEAIYGNQLDKRNFRKRLKTLNIIVPTKEKQKGVSHKPARLFRLNQKAYLGSRDSTF
jgi:8-oxo-dGTP diphosphatase